MAHPESNGSQMAHSLECGVAIASILPSDYIGAITVVPGLVIFEQSPYILDFCTTRDAAMATIMDGLGHDNKLAELWYSGDVSLSIAEPRPEHSGAYKILQGEEGWPSPIPTFSEEVRAALLHVATFVASTAGHYFELKADFPLSHVGLLDATVSSTYGDAITYESYFRSLEQGLVWDERPIPAILSTEHGVKHFVQTATGNVSIEFNAYGPIVD